jgi:hypothetical protein
MRPTVCAICGAKFQYSHTLKIDTNHFHVYICENNHRVSVERDVTNAPIVYPQDRTFLDSAVKSGGYKFKKDKN